MPDLNYFCIENIYEGINSFNLIATRAYQDSSLVSPTLEYSLDDGETWIAYIFPASSSYWNKKVGPTVEIGIGGKCYFRGNNTIFGSRGGDLSCYFTVSQVFNVSGNIMSLLDKTCQLTTFPAGYSSHNCTFNHLLQNTPVVDASNLLLPVLNLQAAYSSYQYYAMFSGCYQLIAPPNLPATTLTTGCYAYMFNGCVSLTVPPTLPNSIINAPLECFMGMFYGCTSLSTPIELPATTLGGSCYKYMFYGCTSLTYSPNLPAQIANGYSYAYMFYGCSSLATAGNISATTFYTYACLQMFRECTSLVNSPQFTVSVVSGEYPFNSMFFRCTNLETLNIELAATDLSNSSGCYLGMFYGTAIKKAPELPATTLSSTCYQEMFKGCTKLEIPPSSIFGSIAPNSCCWMMFQGCTNLKYAPKLPATTLGTNCYEAMFVNCGSLVLPPKLPATNLASYCYLQMFQGCSGLKTLPELPARVLPTECYKMMFAQCIGLQMDTSYQNTKQCIFKLSVDTSQVSSTVGMFTNVTNMPQTPVVNTDYYISLSPQITNRKYKLGTTFTGNIIQEVKCNFMSKNRVFSSIRKQDVVFYDYTNTDLYYDNIKVASISGSTLNWTNTDYQTIILYNGIDTTDASDFIFWLFKNSYQIEEPLTYNLLDYTRVQSILPGEYNIKVKAISETLQDSDWSNSVEYSFSSWIHQKFGLDYIKDFRIGSQEVKKIYYGDELIYTCDYKPQTEAPEISFFNTDFIKLEDNTIADYSVYIDSEKR